MELSFPEIKGRVIELPEYEFFNWRVICDDCGSLPSTFTIDEAKYWIIWHFKEIHEKTGNQP